jgi:predicted nucleic acid-binding protein
LTLVVDASVALKWLYPEEGSDRAGMLLSQRLIAPDLLMVECVNVIWKLSRRGDLSRPEALAAVDVLKAARVELFPMRDLVEEALKIAMAVDHPAYDCVYLALARANACRMVSADARLVGKLAQSPQPGIEVQLL